MCLKLMHVDDGLECFLTSLSCYNQLMCPTYTDATARKFELLRAAPIGFLVQLLNHSDTLPDDRKLVRIVTQYTSQSRAF